jgi:hypothetical protein
MLRLDQWPHRRVLFTRDNSGCWARRNVNP